MTNVFGRCRSATLLAASAAILASAPAASAPSDVVYGPGWSAVHADASNSDYHAEPGPSDLTLAWSRRFVGMINLGPTSDGAGQVYVTTSGTAGSKECRLHALDRATGETIWCSDLLDRLAVSSAPLLDAQGRLFIGDGTAMRAFDRKGTLLWTYPIIGAPLSAQFTPAGDLLFITHVGVIYVLDREKGSERIAPHPLVPDPSFDPSQGAVACMRGLPACPSANTPAIDMKSGRFYFTFWTPGAPAAGIRAMRIIAAVIEEERPLILRLDHTARLLRHLDRAAADGGGIVRSTRRQHGFERVRLLRRDVKLPNSRGAVARLREQHGQPLHVVEGLEMMVVMGKTIHSIPMILLPGQDDGA